MERSPHVTRWLSALLAAAIICGCHDDRGAEHTVEFWTISLRPTFTEYIESRIERFETDHPEVEIRWVDVPFNTIERKLLSAAAAGRAPDVVNMSDMMFARFAAAGAFADVGEHPGFDPAERYHEGALAVGRLGDRQLALPWYLTTQAVICNEALLAEGGLSPETLGTTWDELIDQAGPFHERTGQYLFTQPLGTDSQLPVMLLADGLVPFRVGEGGRLRIDLARPDIEASIGRWVALYRSGAMPREAATRGFEHLIDVYQNERVAAVNTGANFLARVRGVSRDVYARTRVLPPVTGTLGAAHIAVMPVCVSAETDAPEAARAWAAFITSPANQLDFCRLAPILPSTPASLDDPFFAGPTAEEREEGLATIGEARATVASALGDAVAFTPAIEAWPEMRRVFNERIKGALLGGRDAGEVLEEIEAVWAEQLLEMNDRRIASGGSPAGIEAIPEAVRGSVKTDAVATR